MALHVLKGAASAAPSHDRLAACEEVIQRGQRSFIEVGKALLEIRNDRLYRLTHPTFEDYCRERWGFAKSHVYRFIESVGIMDAVSPRGDIPPPRTEKVVRALSPLKDEPEKIAEAWEIANQDGEPTAAKVKEAVDAVRGVTKLSDADFERKVSSLASRGLTKTEIGRRLTGSKSGQSPRVSAAYASWETRKNGGKQPSVTTGKTSPERRRELERQRREGGDYSQFLKLAVEVNRMCGVLEDFDPHIYDLGNEPNLHLMTELHDDLLTLQEWMDRQLAAVWGRLQETDLLAKIAKLREVEGRSPQEVETARRLADRLQRKLDARLT